MAEEEMEKKQLMVGLMAEEETPGEEVYKNTQIHTQCLTKSGLR